MRGLRNEMFTVVRCVIRRPHQTKFSKDEQERRGLDRRSAHQV